MRVGGGVESLKTSWGPGLFVMGGVLGLNFRRAPSNVSDKLENASALGKAGCVITNESNQPTLLLS